MKACVPTPASLGRKKPASPWVRFEWGTARTTSFDGVLSSLSVTYTLFDVDGRPLRATCALSIEEASVDPPGQNPTSGARTARSTHTVVAGDSLALLAWRGVRRRDGLAGHRGGERNRRPDGARARHRTGGAGAAGRGR